MNSTKSSRDKPYFTEAQLLYLEALFPKPKVFPGACRDTMMHDAGSTAVLEAIERRVQGMRRSRIGD